MKGFAHIIFQRDGLRLYFVFSLLDAAVTSLHCSHWTNYVKCWELQLTILSIVDYFLDWAMSWSSFKMSEKLWKMLMTVSQSPRCRPQMLLLFLFPQPKDIQNSHLRSWNQRINVSNKSNQNNRRYSWNKLYFQPRYGPCRTKHFVTDCHQQKRLAVTVF